MGDAVPQSAQAGGRELVQGVPANLMSVREGFKLKKVKNGGIFHVGPDPPPL